MRAVDISVDNSCEEFARFFFLHIQWILFCQFKAAFG